MSKSTMFYRMLLFLQQQHEAPSVAVPDSRAKSSKSKVSNPQS